MLLEYRTTEAKTILEAQDYFSSKMDRLQLFRMTNKLTY
jgi:hypothetical protein